MLMSVDFGDKETSVMTYTMWALVVADEVRNISVDK